MPELPEVETIRRGLQLVLPGQRVAGVEVREFRLRTRIDRKFRSLLVGRTVLDVRRRGKYLLIFLEGEQVWVSHLGMSGKLIYVDAQRPREKHEHIIVSFDGAHELRYHDPRRFGLSLVVSRGELKSLPAIKTLGLEPFDSQFTGDYLYSIARNSRRRIRDLLIDQRVIAGLGNIYANEILFQARIRPTKRAWKLGRRGFGKISQLTPALLQDAIRWCGTSFSDYRDADDRFGEFQNHLMVYDREGQMCKACGSEIKRASVGNRSAFYCPKCQR